MKVNGIDIVFLGKIPNPGTATLQMIGQTIEKWLEPLAKDIQKIWLGKRFIFAPRCDYCHATMITASAQFWRKPPGNGKDLDILESRNNFVAWCPKCDRIYQWHYGSGGDRFEQV